MFFTFVIYAIPMLFGITALTALVDLWEWYAKAGNPGDQASASDGAKTGEGTEFCLEKWQS